ncbi:MAG: cation:proton antiporter [Acidimicrobiia bacterium]|jgi:Kef-type K+ transport system membrane component KefB/nucleotide-binding universal stress UspA family protein
MANLDTVVVLSAAEGGSSLAPLSEHEVLVFLVQLALLVGVARIFGWLMKSVGQPAVVGELLAGVVLGPTLFGRIAPDAFDWVFGEATVTSVIFGISWLGVILLLVVIGFETDLGIIARFRTAALSVSAGALLIPLATAATLAFFVPDSFVGAGPDGSGVDRAVFAGFLALALSVSALPVVAKILQDMGYLRRNFGQVTLAAGMTMDAVGWLVLAALSGIALDGFQPDRLAISFGGLVVFLLAAFTVIRWVIDRLFRFVMSRGSSITAALSITLVAALIGGSITQALNIEAILGAYIVGIIVAGLRHQLPQVRSILETMTAALLAPVFFAFSGLRVDIGLLDTSSVIAWTIILIVAAILAKITGTVIGGFFAGVRGREALALGSGLSALGAMGVVVAIIGLNLGVVSETGYTVMVLAAVVTSVVAPQLLKLVVKGWDIPHEEAERLKEEQVKESSEILRSRRILLPTRGGANSAYAAQLVSAVFPDAEITVLVVDLAKPGLFRRFMRKVEGEPGDPADVLAHLDEARVVRRLARDPAAAIARESALGYDMVVLGATESGEGTFSSVIDRVLAMIEVPSIVVRMPEGRQVADKLPSRILVPVAATRSTRAAEEFAYSLSKAANGRTFALHVVNRPEGQGVMREDAAVEDSLMAGQELVGTAAEFGNRLGVSVETGVRVAPNAEEEIVAFGNSGAFDLLVIGASTRSLTNRPFYGHRVSFMLSQSELPVAVVSLPPSGTPSTPSH